jgi:catechol-2,3-dioxygenase
MSFDILEKEMIVLKFPTIAHLAVTVRDLDASAPWYERLFDESPILDEDTGPFRHVVWNLGGQTLFALNQFADPVKDSKFNERQLGLDHVAFACADRGEIEQWRDWIDNLEIENGGIVEASYGSVLSFRDPDNIALEFFAPHS